MQLRRHSLLCFCLPLSFPPFLPPPALVLLTFVATSFFFSSHIQRHVHSSPCPLLFLHHLAFTPSFTLCLHSSSSLLCYRSSSFLPDRCGSTTIPFIANKWRRDIRFKKLLRESGAHVHPDLASAPLLVANAKWDECITTLTHTLIYSLN